MRVLSDYPYIPTRVPFRFVLEDGNVTAGVFFLPDADSLSLDVADDSLWYGQLTGAMLRCNPLFNPKGFEFSVRRRPDEGNGGSSS